MNEPVTPTPAVQSILDAYNELDGAPYESGGVRIEDLTIHESDTGSNNCNSISVSVPDLPDPHFVIVNPPVHVADPDGDIVGGDGTRYRLDPLAAIAEVIGMHGGAQ